MARKSSDPHRGELAKVVSHLAGLGAKGWLLIAVLIAVVWAVERYGGGGSGGETPDVATPGGAVAERPADEFGTDPFATGERADEAAGAPAGTPVVRLTLAAGGGRFDAEFPPDRLLLRSDGKGPTTADRLNGGERIKTACGRDAEVVAVTRGPAASNRPPPDCPPVAVPTVVRDVSVKNFGREVSRGDVNIGGTLRRIAAGERDSHRNDGSVFGNREHRLPNRPRGYYREYVHRTPGVDGPGPQRLIVGELGDLWYTPDHYDSFRPVVQP